MTESNSPPGVSFFMCGPSNAKCVCKCPDGPCDHDWDGPTIRTENSESASCSKCGTEALSHSMWVL